MLPSLAASLTTSIPLLPAPPPTRSTLLALPSMTPLRAPPHHAPAARPLLRQRRPALLPTRRLMSAHLRLSPLLRQRHRALPTTQSTPLVLLPRSTTL